MSSSTSHDTPFPLVKADQIAQSLVPHSHFLYPKANINIARMSDMVGMSGLGVNFVKLDPEAESTCIHYHLIDSEWIYVLAGSGVLQLVDAGITALHDESHPLYPKSKTSTAPISDMGKSTFSLSPLMISTGDFMGFSGGVGAQKHAHGLKAGKDGMTYLVGGTRSGKDVCYYPL
ncbi:hypothetical protein TREMEDRAFT_35271 [Tremella mesenterica DSM 1558]|uniref:uncharacterized protein n=1 Tax=Tremella mesenterica (strain ATCC 24925 / CBS 8224 / DSM 1558 / NBRC 9311 / NRRL Y-6157 / RJB 2259-6 / UBC 559-6) TaxID=578456 RepID=UPI00032D1A6D|nr:uncharacterized protein TREMEDRAFT_35271 [Tremella mesenterica DSM 1558]EIW66246.1 hypothetical protein TREMEDRAFT_35271 [Tremella mesenterica DSM 1558]